MADLMRAGNGVIGNGFKTGYENVIEPKNKFERGVYEATKTAYDTLTGASVGGLAATSKTVTAAATASNKLVRGVAKGAQYLLYPGAYSAQVGAAEGALAATSLLDLKKPDDDASLGKKAAYTAANMGVGLAGAIAGGGVGAGVGHVVNRQAIKRGKNELARQLKTQEYADINAGRISRRALMEVNDIRLKEGVEMARDNTLWIPRKQVEHIFERRVNGKMHPEQVANVVSDFVKAKKVTVKAGNKIENQELSYIPKGATSGRVGYVSVFKDEKRIPSFIERISGVRLDERLGLVTAMKKKVKKLK